jgi:hypothetical protein
MNGTAVSQAAQQFFNQPVFQALARTTQWAAKLDLVGTALKRLEYGLNTYQHVRNLVNARNADPQTFARAVNEAVRYQFTSLAKGLGTKPGTDVGVFLGGLGGGAVSGGNPLVVLGSGLAGGVAGGIIGGEVAGYAAGQLYDALGSSEVQKFALQHRQQIVTMLNAMAPVMNQLDQFARPLGI